MMKSTLIAIALVPIFFPALLNSQATPSPSDLPGPCRTWLLPCENGTWTCGSDEQYWRFRLYGSRISCPVPYPQTTSSPPGECEVVNGVCQFTNASLECATWLNSCTGYQCGSVSEYGAFLEEPGPACPIGSQYPEPDDLCIPINDTCQWYNPCRSWRGFCWAGYNCGTNAQYYQFILGPQPLCSPPPPGWVPPLPPGNCAVRNGQCDWYNCTAWLDWCRTYWTCGTQYEESIYQAGPPPPCPAPPPGYQPPAQPGVCQFNISAGQCQFQVESTNTCSDGTPMVSCFTDPCGECPNYPNARCEANYCGGCNAVYYDENGNNVTAYCRTYTGCELLLCSPGSKCIGNPVTGSAYCEPSCEASCRNDQLCQIQQYISGQYPVCYNAPYVSCSSADVRAKCVANSRCLVQNKTREIACIQSCFENNGGCGDNQVCINVVNECSDSHSSYGCSSQIQCRNLNDLSPRCPAGWESSTCGSTCGSTCENVLAQETVACPEVCYNGCFCPRGLVVYRDRCVDPKECYVLLKNPPVPNPLPVKSSTVLLEMTLPRLTRDEFKNKTQQFLSSFQQLLLVSDYSGVDVTIHAVYFDEELQVVVKLSGVHISSAKSSELVAVVSNNAASLPLSVKNVNALPTQTISSQGGLSAGIISVIVVAAVMVLLMLVIVALIVVVTLKHKANKQLRQQELSNDMNYSKLTSAYEKNSPTTEESDDFQKEKEAL